MLLLLHQIFLNVLERMFYKKHKKNYDFYSLGKFLEKETKTIEDRGQKQIKATEEHRKQLV